MRLSPNLRCICQTPINLKTSVFFALFLALACPKGHAIPSSTSTTAVLPHPTDTSAPKPEPILKIIFSGPPAKAFAMSLLLPGSGQIYNRKYWKLPFVYGALAGMGYIVYVNRKNYQRLDRAYRMRVDLGQASMDEFQGIYNVDQLQSLRQQYSKILFESYVRFGLVYLAVAVDAYVDRHLLHFDISDELSWQWGTPPMPNGSGSPAAFTIHYHW